MFWHCLTVCLVASLVDAASIGETGGRSTLDCDSKIYCQGNLLKTFQLAEIYNDSKTFVDLHQLHDPDVTLSNFDQLMEDTDNNPNRTQLEQFIKDNFSEDDELETWSPPDWQQNPSRFNHIQDPNFRKWAYDLNDLWKNLGRKIKPEVAENPNRHSLIYVENGFVIPGGRFREYYYWDSYWVIEGLLLSGMNQTAEGMMNNFLKLVQDYGFIPNGGRVYYLMRSQPPLLIPMVDMYLEYTNNLFFLRKNIGLLEDEFAFWQRERTVEIEKNGKTYKLARYIVSSEGPRPESYREDYGHGQKISADQLTTFYENLKAAAESGWDFSARWFIADDGTKGNITEINTRNIIPVDLNSFLQRNARLLSEFNTKLGNDSKAKYYAKIAQDYQEAIEAFLWNEEEGVWLDYDMKNKIPRNSFYPTNLAPLYTKSFDISKAKDYAESAVDYLKRNGIMDFMGGTPASLDHTGEQWDFPNAWPPLQSIIVGGLRETGWEPATSLAKCLATRWLRANYAGYLEYQEMFEKYDAVNVGQYGDGGEYTVQAGFGWTNGVVLEFLDLYSSTVSTQDELTLFNESNDCGDNAER